MDRRAPTRQVVTLGRRSRLRARDRERVPADQIDWKEWRTAAPERDRGVAGITLGGVIVIVGIVLMIVWSFWIGLIIALIGLIAFGGFARGKWY